MVNTPGALTTEVAHPARLVDTGIYPPSGSGRSRPARVWPTRCPRRLTRQGCLTRNPGLIDARIAHGSPSDAMISNHSGLIDPGIDSPGGRAGYRHDRDQDQGGFLHSGRLRQCLNAHCPTRSSDKSGAGSLRQSHPPRPNDCSTPRGSAGSFQPGRSAPARLLRSPASAAANESRGVRQASSMTSSSAFQQNHYRSR